jgi:hypothetical protein
MTDLKTATTTISMEVAEDFVARQAKGSPIQALAEFIWNGLDADATLVEVELNRSELRLEEIIVRDNGLGIPRSQAEELFGRLGGSWKKLRRTTSGGRVLHGREGRGRLRAAVLGRVADWHVVYDDEHSGERRAYTITLIADNLREITISAEQSSSSPRTGVELRITETIADFRSLQGDETAQELAELFASYLRNYRSVRISYQGILLDTADAIASEKAYSLEDSEDSDGHKHPARLEIVEWKRPTKRALYLCDENGFPLTQSDSKFQVGPFFFSAYLRSSLIRKMEEENLLPVGEFQPEMARLIDGAKAALKSHFRQKAAEEAKTAVAQWKAENSYPYEGPPKSPLEEIERQVFDIVALAASQHVPGFDEANQRTRAFQLRMLKQAVEKSPDDLQLIMKEVLRLPARELESLASLLRETSLTAVISAAKVVSDRLKFLAGIEAILFDPQMKKALKERRELHRILADNTWLFGEAFNLMVDDQGLTECLRQHQKGRDDPIVIDEPVRHPSKTVGIVDLMFSKVRGVHRPSDQEHLVVELKRPSVSIRLKEVGQIEGYVQAILDDSRFDTNNTKWNFWVLSNEIDPGLLKVRQVKGAPDGVIILQDNVCVILKTWAQVIQENRARMQFFQERLEHRTDAADALDHLRSRYARYLSSIETMKSADDIEEEGEAEPLPQS